MSKIPRYYKGVIGIVNALLTITTFILSPVVANILPASTVVYAVAALSVLNAIGVILVRNETAVVTGLEVITATISDASAKHVAAAVVEALPAPAAAPVAAPAPTPVVVPVIVPVTAPVPAPEPTPAEPAPVEPTPAPDPVPAGAVPLSAVTPAALTQDQADSITAAVATLQSLVQPAPYTGPGV